MFVHEPGCNRAHDEGPCARTHDAGCHGWHDEGPCFGRPLSARPSAEVARRVAARHDRVQQLREMRRQTWLMMAALVGNVDGGGVLSPEGARAWEDLNRQLARIDGCIANQMGHSRVHSDYPGWIDVTAVGDQERTYLPGGPMAPANLTGTSAGIGYAGAQNAPGWTAAELAAAEAGEFVASTVITGPCADCGMDDEPVDSDRRCRYCAALRALPKRPKRPARNDRHHWACRGDNPARWRCSRCRARHGEVTSRGGVIAAQGPCPGRPARRARARRAAQRAAIASLAGSLLTSSIGMQTVSGYLAVAGATLLLLLWMVVRL